MLKGRDKSKVLYLNMMFGVDVWDVVEYSGVRRGRPNMLATREPVRLQHPLSTYRERQALRGPVL